MALPDLSELDTLNEADMVAQIYRLQNENSGSDSVHVFYKGCIFALNFADGSVEQQMVKQGGVSSRLAPAQAAEYANQIKAAHALAAHTKLLDLIKSINDDAIKVVIRHATSGHSKLSAIDILDKLTVTPVLPTLTAFGIFRAGAATDSPALSVVREVLDKISVGTVTTLKAVDNVWKEIEDQLAVLSQRPKISGDQ